MLGKILAWKWLRTNCSVAGATNASSVMTAMFFMESPTVTWQDVDVRRALFLEPEVPYPFLEPEVPYPFGILAKDDDETMVEYPDGSDAVPVSALGETSDGTTKGLGMDVPDATTTSLEVPGGTTDSVEVPDDTTASVEVPDPGTSVEVSDDTTASVEVPDPGTMAPVEVPTMASVEVPDADAMVPLAPLEAPESPEVPKVSTSEQLGAKAKSRAAPKKPATPKSAKEKKKAMKKGSPKKKATPKKDVQKQETQRKKALKGAAAKTKASAPKRKAVKGTMESGSKKVKDDVEGGSKKVKDDVEGGSKKVKDDVEKKLHSATRQQKHWSDYHDSFFMQVFCASKVTFKTLWFFFCISIDPGVFLRLEVGQSTWWKSKARSSWRSLEVSRRNMAQMHKCSSLEICSLKILMIVDCFFVSQGGSATMGLRIIPRCLKLLHSLPMFESWWILDWQQIRLCFAFLLWYQLEMHQHDASGVDQK